MVYFRTSSRTLELAIFSPCWPRYVDCREFISLSTHLCLQQVAPDGEHCAVCDPIHYVCLSSDSIVVGSLSLMQFLEAVHLFSC